MDDLAPFSYLSSVSSIFICLIFSLIYVFGLYLLSPPSHRYDRNHPNVIRRRFLAVLIVCSSIYLLLKLCCNPTSNIHLWLGFRTDVASLWRLIFLPIGLTLLLYIGPILQWISVLDWQHYRNYCFHLSFTNWDDREKLMFLRNYLVAPFTEEFVFRSTILCLLYSHVSLKAAIFISPLFFGLAHFHHMIEHFKQNQNEKHSPLSFMTIIAIHLFQFSYTYMFGIYSSFIFIRSGHFLPSFLVHMLCNSLGLPDILHLVHFQDGKIRFKCVLIVFYALGLWLFSTHLYSWTESKFYYKQPASVILYQQWLTHL